MPTDPAPDPQPATHMPLPPDRPTPADARPAGAPVAGERYTAFDGRRLLLAGALPDVALAVKRAAAGGAVGPLLIFDDRTGRVVHVDTRGTEEDVVSRLPLLRSGSRAPGGSPPEDLRQSAPSPAPAAGDTGDAGARRRGRPRLGVIGREVTLLPRHWEWLAAQSGGASAALRRLVEEARRASADQARWREARDAAYRFMSTLGADLPGFEEAARALFAADAPRLGELVGGWPPDIRDHLLALASRGAPAGGPAPMASDAAPDAGVS